MNALRPSLRGIASSGGLHGFVWCVTLLAVWLVGPTGWGSTRGLAVVAAVLFVAGFLSVRACQPGRSWDLSGMYLLVFGVFHLGLIPYWILDVQPTALVRDTDSSWFNGSLGREALFLAVLGMIAYCAAVTLGTSFRPAPPTSVPVQRDGPHGHRIEVLGSWMVLAGVAMWLYASISVGGYGFFLLPYGEYFTLISDTPLSDGVFSIIGLGFCFLMAGQSGRPLPRLALWLFAAWGVLAFLMGTRGVVLFPLAVGVSIAAQRRRLPGLLPVTLAILAALYLIDVAKQVRQRGLGSVATAWADASPLTAVGELGGTLRVVAHAIYWHREGGLEHAGGVTYVAWLVRQFEGVFGIVTPVPDYRLFNVLVMERSGAIGGSVVAEAYHNFEVVGPILALAATGWLMAWLGSRPGGPREWAITAAVALPLFVHIRNAFVPVVPTVALGVLLVLVLTRKRAESRPEAKPL